jgi:hypothetical protein
VYLTFGAKPEWLMMVGAVGVVVMMVGEVGVVVLVLFLPIFYVFGCVDVLV